MVDGVVQQLTINVASSGTREVRLHTLSLRVCLEEMFMDFAAELTLCKRQLYNLYDIKKDMIN